MNYSEYRDRFSSVEEFMRDFGKRTYEEAYEMIDAEICPDSIKGCMIQKWHQARRKAKLGSICVDIGDNGALRIVFFENDSDIDGNVFQYGYCIDDMKRIVVGMTGASGAILGIRLLELLKKARVETHLVISEYGEKTILAETDRSVREVLSLADRTYDNGDLSAAIASGSFQFDAMVICPCSMKTLAAIYTGLSDSLITRAADVCIKERRKLILLPRETPLSPIHLRNMQYLSEIGVSILPPMMTFYTDPVCIEDMIGQILLKVLDQIGLEHASGRRWSGMPDEKRPKRERLPDIREKEKQ